MVCQVYTVDTGEDESGPEVQVTHSTRLSVSSLLIQTDIINRRTSTAHQDDALSLYIHLDLSFLSVTYTCEISSLYSLLWVVFLFRVRQSMTDRVTLIYSKTYYTLLMIQWEIFNAYHQLKEAEKKGSRKKYVVIKNWYEKKGTTTTENRK